MVQLDYTKLMKDAAKQRNELYAEALSLLKYPSYKKIGLLYHLIYSCKIGDEYILSTLSEIRCFVAFINENLDVNEI